MTAKIDMSKAYDRVKWAFLEFIIRQLGFPEAWISLVVKCVSSDTFSFFVTGNTVGVVKPNRGIRQSDPLSPYLFLLVSEGLPAILHKACRDKRLYAISICHRAPTISHLLFADDSLLFMRGSLSEAIALRDVLHLFE